MNNLFKNVLWLLTTLAVSPSGFCNGSSNTFGIGLLLGTTKSKIDINGINKDDSNAFVQNLKSGLQQINNVSLQDLTIKIKNNPPSEKSDFRFDTGVVAFYQHNFNDIFFTRIGAFGNFTVAKNTLSILNETISLSSSELGNYKLNTDVSFKHLFDVGGQLLVGFNMTKLFSFVIGGEFGYTKGELKLNATINDKNILNNNTACSFGALFGGVVCGVEFNFKNFVVGVHGFLHSLKIKDSNFKFKDKNGKTFTEMTNNTNSSKKSSSIGVRLMVAYKF